MIYIKSTKDYTYIFLDILYKHFFFKGKKVKRRILRKLKIDDIDFYALKKELSYDLFRYNEDPALKDLAEVVFAYPGFYATFCYRIGHLIAENNIPIIPRIISSIAIEKTGVDISPYATIGHALFIDHGIGTVIGETAIIGSNVTIYQGVLLGALNPSKEHGIKRHPTVGNYVTLYANSMILGDIKIPDKTIIKARQIITKETNLQ